MAFNCALILSDSELSKIKSALLSFKEGLSEKDREFYLDLIIKIDCFQKTHKK